MKPMWQPPIHFIIVITSLLAATLFATDAVPDWSHLDKQWELKRPFSSFGGMVVDVDVDLENDEIFLLVSNIPTSYPNTTSKIVILNHALEVLREWPLGIDAPEYPVSLDLSINKEVIQVTSGSMAGRLYWLNRSGEWEKEVHATSSISKIAVAEDAQRYYVYGNDFVFTSGKYTDVPFVHAYNAADVLQFSLFDGALEHELTRVRAMAIAPDGRFCVWDNNSLKWYEENGTFIASHAFFKESTQPAMLSSFENGLLVQISNGVGDLISEHGIGQVSGLPYGKYRNGRIYTTVGIYGPDDEEWLGLDVAVSPSPAHGSVAGEGIFSVGDVATLTATPTLQGWAFSHWSGDIESTEMPLTIQMEADVRIVANFVYNGFSSLWQEVGYFEGIDISEIAWFSQGPDQAGEIFLKAGYHPGEPDNVALELDPVAGMEDPDALAAVFATLPLPSLIELHSHAVVGFSLFMEGPVTHAAFGVSSKGIDHESGQPEASFGPADFYVAARVGGSDYLQVRDGFMYRDTNFIPPLNEWFHVYLFVDHQSQTVSGYAWSQSGGFIKLEVFVQDEITTSSWMFRDPSLQEPLSHAFAFSSHSDSPGGIKYEDLVLIDDIRIFYGSADFYEIFPPGEPVNDIYVDDANHLRVGELEFVPPVAEILENGNLSWEGMIYSKPDATTESGTSELIFGENRLRVSDAVRVDTVVGHVLPEAFYIHALSYEDCTTMMGWMVSYENSIYYSVASNSFIYVPNYASALVEDFWYYHFSSDEWRRHGCSPDAPLILNSLQRNVRAGTSFSHDLICYPLPDYWEVSGLPAGMVFNDIYQRIEGIALSLGKFQIQLRAYHGDKVASATLFITANPLVSLTLSGLNVVYNGNPQPVTVTSSVVGLNIEVLYNGQVSPPVNAGTYQVRAKVIDTYYPYYESEVTGTLTIQKAHQSIVFNLPANITFGDEPIPLTAYASTGLPITYTSSKPQAATISNNMLNIHHSDEITITARQAGNANYHSAQVQVMRYVQQQILEISIQDLEQIYTGTPRAVKVITNPPGIPVNIQYRKEGDHGLTMWEPPVEIGTYDVWISNNHTDYGVSSHAVMRILYSAFIPSETTIDHGGDWKENGLGLVHDSMYPFVFWETWHSWMYMHTDTQANIYFYLPEQQLWAWTHETIFPWVHILGSQTESGYWTHNPDVF